MRTERFGRLTLIREIGLDSQGYALWLCCCECGSEETARLWDVRLKSKYQKGCRTCRKHKAIRLSDPNARLDQVALAAALRRRFREYQGGAKTRGLIWSLTEDQFSNLVSQDCHYCGVIPGRACTALGKTFLFNGIDRMDSKQGYVPDNCVPCCTMCNLSKRETPYREFIQWLARAAAYTNRASAS